jgi:ribonucleoside-triphosphate reductase
MKERWNKYMKVKKRNGNIVDFDVTKIECAISNANKEVEGKDKLNASEIKLISNIIQDSFNDDDTIDIETIQDLVENKLMSVGKFELAKAYIIYREKHSMLRRANSTDNTLMKLINQEDEYSNTENSNKNTTWLSTERDYIAGVTSIDVTDRLLLPERIVKAHNDGVLHFHDKDYFMQKGMFNCCLINIGDMLDNGTAINGKMIETPKSFQVACTVMTQIIANIASNQYGK